MDNYLAAVLEKLWEQGPAVVVLGLVVWGFVSGKIVPGYMYKEKQNECTKLSDQNSELTKLTNTNALNARHAQDMAERLIEELQKGRG